MLPASETHSHSRRVRLRRKRDATGVHGGLRYVNATSRKLARAIDAAVYMTAFHDCDMASGVNINKPRARPSGQLTTSTDIAVTTSRPTNQSATILVTRTLISTAPMPLI